MAKNIVTMDHLKKEAVRVYTGMIAVYPQFSQEEKIDLSELTPKFNGCFATNNSTVCFITENEIYATPYTRTVVDTLRGEGFIEKCFFVPFSNWDYPKDEQDKWKMLRENAQQSYIEDFISDCEAYCDEHHVGAISDKSLENCFEMPESGVKVRHLGYEATYYPVMNQRVLDCSADNLGRYCSNNGRVVFVYRNGRTYVTKGYKILSELQEAGYTEFGLFVPFSNCEEIMDENLKDRWATIQRK